MSNNESAVKRVRSDFENIENQTENAFAKMKDKVGEQISNVQDKSQVVKEKVSENLSTAADRVHLKSDQTQEFLDKKAEEITNLAHRTIEKANTLGHKAGDVLNSTSEYVRNFDVAETGKQVKATFKKNPGTSLLAVGIVGLLLGLLIGRNNKSR